ncbi:MAG: hypothetical protein NVSMB2_16010 [Chloroflexota bacterium]
MNGPSDAEDKGMKDDTRGRPTTIVPVDYLPSPRPVRLANPCDSARDRLVRYFAWGYLSRREVLHMLEQLESQGGARHPVAA